MLLDESFFTGKKGQGIDLLKKIDFSHVEITKNMQGKGFEPSDLFRTRP